MSNIAPILPSMDFANVCAAHTRRVRLLSGKFWHYRKLSRELTQQFMDELVTLLSFDS